MRLKWVTVMMTMEKIIDPLGVPSNCSQFTPTINDREGAYDLKGRKIRIATGSRNHKKWILYPFRDYSCDFRIHFASV